MLRRPQENKGREHVGRRGTLCDRLPVDHGGVHRIFILMDNKFEAYVNFNIGSYAIELYRLSWYKTTFVFLGGLLGNGKSGE